MGAYSMKGVGSTFHCTFPIFFSMDQVPSDMLEKNEEKEEEKFKNVNWREVGDGLDGEVEDVRIWHRNRIFVKKSPQESIVILCDDFPSVRRMVSRQLERLEFKKVVQLADGTKLVDYFSDNPENDVDVIICDEEMPDLNGSLAVRELRKMGVEIPIVMHSGNSLEHQQALFYLRKADGLVSKPANREKLVGSLSPFINFELNQEEKK